MRIRPVSKQRKYIIPEVVQTSSMDCGPASLNSLLGGFGIITSYGRLREACQTNIDGTSIDTLEEAAVALGLDAEQIMVPADHLLIDEACALPALTVVRLPTGAVHFVVIWRKHGRFLQIMDPAIGRRWPIKSEFINQLYIHTHMVPAKAWREWAAAGEFTRVLFRRFKDISIHKQAESLTAKALSDDSWHSIAALDAALRLTSAVVCSRGIKRGSQACSVLVSFYERVIVNWNEAFQVIPPEYWSVLPGSESAGDDETVKIKGVVLIRVKGRIINAGINDKENHTPPLSGELSDTLLEHKDRPILNLFRFLKEDGLFTPLVTALAFILGAAAVVLQAVLFQSIFNFGRTLDTGLFRFAGIFALISFNLILLLLESSAASGIYGIGRRLEIRVRMAFLKKIPGLGDRYFHSRLISDMAERGHSIHHIRQLPYLGSCLIQYLFELFFTVCGIIWLEPDLAILAIPAGIAAIMIPLFCTPALSESDFRARNHIGALSRFFLDTFLGLSAIKTHGAQKSIRSEHEQRVTEWAKSRIHLQQVLSRVEGLHLFIGYGFAGLLLAAYFLNPGRGHAALLLTFWVLNIPYIGQELILLLRAYALYRNIALRTFEPLEAKEEAVPVTTASPDPGFNENKSKGAVSIRFDNVYIKALGNMILHEVNLSIPAGSKIAIVGESGAGKSTLVGALLGWHWPVSGRIEIDNHELDATALVQLRRRMVWVDPAVQIWNRSLLNNLTYGADSFSGRNIGIVLNQSELIEVLQRLPRGLQSILGEGGGLLSGGEGQRLRLARALLRQDTGLVILDEPFRGLERTRRHELLAQTRVWWKNATLLCITHDISETFSFDRVLVMENGRVAEDGAPDALNSDPGSRYHSLLETEARSREQLWSDTIWRKVHLENGQLIEKVQEKSQE